MKKIKIVSLLLLITVATGFAQQGEFRMNAGVVAGVPVGGLKDLTGNTSLRGVDVALLYGVSEKVSVGLNLAYQDFYEKFPRAVYKMADGSDISAVLSNSVQQIPILATVRYHFKPGSAVQPYVSAGLGGTISLYRQFLGEYPSSDNKFGFAARPEAGIYMPFRKQGSTGVNLAVQYTYAPYNKYGIKSLDYIGVKLGIGFPLRD